MPGPIAGACRAASNLGSRQHVGFWLRLPPRRSRLEGARLHPPDFIVNTVLAPNGQLAGVFAGDLDLAHRAACGLVKKIDRVVIDRKADFVVADAGGAGTWIQAHKALFNAVRAVQEDGRIILLAP